MPSTTVPSSVMSWKRPVAGVHPRIYMTNRMRVTIGSITNGPFAHGATITWSGGSGKVVETTANGASPLYYEPVSGVPVLSGQVITSGSTTVTAILDASSDGLSVAAVTARKNGAMAPEWATLQSYVNNTAVPNSGNPAYWDDNRAPEQMASMAFSYLVGGNTTHGNAAITAAIGLAGGSDLDGSTGRAHMTALAMVYDWCYGLMSSTQRNTIRTALAQPGGGDGYIESRFNPPEDEYMTGTAHGDICYAFICLIATMEDDPDTADCNTQVGWMNTMMDNFDNGTNSECYWPIFRYFGNTDGGTYKGVGTYGYNVVNLDFYHRVLFIGQSGLVTDFYAQEPWYGKMFDWTLWHLRPDLNNFGQGDERHGATSSGGTEPSGGAGSQFHLHASVNALQILHRDTTIRRNFAQWYLKSWVSQAANQVIWGPYHMFNVMWGRTTAEVAATEPTLDNANGGSPVKHFEAAGKTVIRNGWKKTSTAMAICRPSKWIGNHQHSDVGDFQIAAHEEALAVKHGHYDPNASSPGSGGTIYQHDTSFNIAQASTWKLFGGHRYTYMQSALSKNMVRVFSQDEDNTATLIKDSFQKLCGASSAFGRGHMSGSNWVGTFENFGGPLNPKKDPGGSCQAEPSDLTELLATAEWNRVSLAHAKPYNGENHVYLVLNLSTWYWSGKQTRMRRHFLWIKENVVGSFSNPIILIWDDLVTTVDAHATLGGKKTQIEQLQTQVAPQAGGTASSMSFAGARGKGKLFVRVVAPAVEHRFIGGSSFQGMAGATGTIYPPTNVLTYDDSSLGCFRNEWNPAAPTTSPQFLFMLVPAPISATSTPTPQLIDEATAYGVRFISGSDIIEARMAKGDTHSVTVGSPTDTWGPPPHTTPPATPTPSPPLAVAGDNQVALTWNAQGELDLAGYRVYRGTKTGGVFGADVLIGTVLPIASPAYTDLTAVNGTTYRYAISAFDITTPTANESAKTAYTGDQTPAGPPPPDNPPAAPTGAVAVAGDNLVDLDWNDNGEADLGSYKVYREQFTGGAWQAETLVTTITGSPPVSLFQDTTASNGNTYRYRVGAVDTPGGQESARSAYSNTVSPAAPPGPGSTNNKLRSSWQWLWNILPAPTGPPLGEGDRRHVMGLYALEAIPPPPPDISIGDPLVCDEPVEAGATIEVPAPAAGAPITHPAPATGAPISEDDP